MPAARSLDADAPRATPVDARASKARRYLYAVLACAVTTALAQLLSAYFAPANIVMLFLLAVVLVAMRYGRGPAVLAAFLSVGLFDFFCVPPHFSLAVSDAQYLLTFSVMLVVTLIIGHLTAGLRSAAEQSALREQRTRSLYEMARSLAGAPTLQQVKEISDRFAGETLQARIAIVLPDARGGILVRAEDRWIDETTARLAYEAGSCTDSDAALPAFYVPLTAPSRVRGVMAVARDDGALAPLADQQPLLQAVASLIGIAVERLHYVEVAHRSQMQIASERLRSSILSALSHDVRTPLTALVGLADTLVLGKLPLPAPQHELAVAIREQTLRLSEMVSKLLDMARLSAGNVRLCKEWQPLQEVIGSSLKLLAGVLQDRPVEVSVPPGLPLVKFDAVLVERVLCNLLENADKYSAPGLPVEVTAAVRGDCLAISVCDRGPGVPPDAERLFEQFERGDQESAQTGVGLGLAISRTIVEAHGGAISARNRPEGGACFTFTLPIGTPPAIEAEDTVTMR